MDPRWYETTLHMFMRSGYSRTDAERKTRETWEQGQRFLERRVPDRFECDVDESGGIDKWGDAA